MADTNLDKVFKDLEKWYKTESKDLEEYQKWVDKMDKGDYTELAWDVAQETLSMKQDRVNDLLLQIIDISTNN